MKITLFFLLISISTVFAKSSYSQNTKLSMHLENVTIQKVFDEIQKNSEFIIFYKDDQVNLNHRSNVNLDDATVNQILDQTLDGTNLEYKIIDRQIVILTNKKEESPTVIKSVPNAEQIKELSGTVKDSKGLPLPGVTVIAKGTTKGIITDNDGNFRLSVPNDVKILVFSFIGMKTQELQIGVRTSFSVTLEEEKFGMDEVVVVGYGTQKKVNLTGAIGMATSERLENRPIVSVGQGLQGVIPNLNIEIRNGDPTRATDYNIRGFESINGGSPLILVDGVPMDLDALNPDDISSVTVLKDAAAAAVYGARAAFGVILVETKKGKKGKVSVTLSTEQSLAKPIWHLDPVTDPHQFVLAWNTANMRTYGVPMYDDGYVEGTRQWVENPTDENAWKVVNGVLRFYGNSEYQKKIITDYSPQQKYNMNISGATEKASYYVSFGFLNKDGYLRDKGANENYNRYNGLMKTDFQVTDWLSLDEKISFNSEVNDKPHSYQRSVNINSVGRTTPITPIKFPDLPYYIDPGDHEKYEPYIGMYIGSNSNWFPYLKGGRTTFTTNDTWLTQGVTLTPLKGFRVRGEFSYHTYWRDYQDVASKVEMTDGLKLQPVSITNGFSGNDFIDNQNNRSQGYVFNTYAEYEMNQITDHYIKAMVGFNQEWGRNNFIEAKASTLLTPSITDLNATSGIQSTGGSKNHFALRGAFYRLNYIYKDKYLIESDGRYDGTSRFPKKTRFGFFPSLSLGWRLSKEPFMASTNNWLDNLKFRASYGELGNQMVDYYPYISSMGSGMAPYIMTSGYIPYVSASSLVSPNLTWETVATQNLGVDFTVSRRLDVSFDAFIRDTKNMLMNVSYPDVLGTSAPKENAADLRNRGWELSITWRDKIGQNWKYGLNIGLSDNQAEITKFENPTGAFATYYVGKKIGEIWGFKTVGIFQSDKDVAAAPDQSQLGANWKAGDIQYADLNNDGKITRGSQTLSDPGDMTIIGNSSARYSFGISPDVSYKNWTLNVFFQGLFRDNLPITEAWDAFYPYNSGVVEKWYLNETWSENNRNAYFPAPHIATDDFKNYQGQSRFVQNAAYIRLKNLTLNYNFPMKLIKKVGLSRAQVYISGLNLWEYSKMHKPLDPESIYTTDQEYYQQRIYSLGLKITL